MKSKFKYIYILGGITRSRTTLRGKVHVTAYYIAECLIKLICLGHMILFKCSHFGNYLSPKVPRLGKLWMFLDVIFFKENVYEAPVSVTLCCCSCCFY